MREKHQVDHAVRFIDLYRLSQGKGNLLPLSKRMSTHFRSNQKMGSKDRRLFSELVYSYFRIGRMEMNLPTQERLALAYFLSQDKQSSVLLYLLKEHRNWEKNIKNSIEEKLSLIQECYPNFIITDLFPSHGELSGNLRRSDFSISHFIQPKLWIRVRIGFIHQVQSELEKVGISFEISTLSPNAWALPNRTPLESLKCYRLGYFEVQDLSSQLTAERFLCKKGQVWWDACCGAGGKSLMLLDKEPSLKLYLSDQRISILRKLKTRLGKANLRVAAIKQWKLMAQDGSPFSKNWDGIIADVPCSGSGTWGRTPELLLEVIDLDRYHKRQVQMVELLLEHLEIGKELIYITCSVFKKENEDVVESVLEKSIADLVDQKLIAGYKEKADSLFVATFVKV